jgi:RNA polymerase subunit RPABC4/transcription elongation factor Spt4
MAGLTCGVCQTVNDPGSDYCRACGSELTTTMAAPPVELGATSAGPAPGSANVCPDCGLPVEHAAPACPRCGAELPAAADAERVSSVPDRGAQMPLSVVGSCTVVLAFPWGRVPVNTGESFVVGRGEGPLAESLAAYPTVGRRQAQIERNDTGVFVTDLVALNPTYIDGSPIQGGRRAELRLGQTLGLSSQVKARLEESDAA